MTTAVQLRRGTTAETAAFTGLEGETTVDTTKDTLVVHNGSTAGGFPIAREDLTNVSPTNLPSITGDATASDDTFLIYDQSALTLKKITRAELNNAIEQDPLSSVQIVSGTINGTTIGGTTAADGTFINLSYTGTLTGGTGVVNLGSGQVYKDASGNVGIGTTSPDGNFEVRKSSSLDVRFTAASNAGLKISQASSGASPRFGVIGAGLDLVFEMQGSDRMRIDSAGNLGLGVTPSAWGSGWKAFQMQNGAWMSHPSVSVNYLLGNSYFDSTNYRYLVDGYATEYQFGGYQGKHIWLTAPSGTAGNAISFTQAMTLDASGNLGIGATSPSCRLQIASTNSAAANNTLTGSWVNIGSSLTSGLGMRQRGDSAGISGTTFPFQMATIGGFPFEIYTADSQPLVFGTAATERMRIDSSGNLLVGTTSSGARLYVRGPASASYPSGIGLIESTSSGDLAYPAFQLSKFDNNTTTSQILVKFLVNNGGTAQGQINANGASQAAFGAWSDRRLKQNIVGLPPQLDNICALRPVEFDYIESEGGGHQIGFVAQEVQEIYPDLVGERADGMLTLTGLNKNEARLIKAIQEQQAIIESLKARLDAANI